RVDTQRLDLVTGREGAYRRAPPQPRNEGQEVPLARHRARFSDSRELGQQVVIGGGRKAEEPDVTLAHLGHRIALAALADSHDLITGVAYEMDVRGSARHCWEDEGALGVVRGVCG